MEHIKITVIVQIQLLEDNTNRTELHETTTNSFDI